MLFTEHLSDLIAQISRQARRTYNVVPKVVGVVDLRTVSQGIDMTGRQGKLFAGHDPPAAVHGMTANVNNKRLYTWTGSRSRPPQTATVDLRYP